MDNKRYDLSNVLVTGASGNIGKAICSILKYNKINFKKLSKYSKNKIFSFLLTGRFIINFITFI